MLNITAIYASLIALVFIVLSVRVIQYRRGERVSLGDGDGEHSELRKRVRAHANCAEYAPFGLLLLALAELQAAPTIALHLLGMMLLLGRLAHGYSLSAPRPQFGLRTLGMGLTFSMIGLTAIGLLVHSLF